MIRCVQWLMLGLLGSSSLAANDVPELTIRFEDDTGFYAFEWDASDPDWLPELMIDLTPSFSRDGYTTVGYDFINNLESGQRSVRVSDFFPYGYLRLYDFFGRLRSENPEVVELESGLHYLVVEAGDGGATPSPSSTVRVIYTGSFPNGAVFDTSTNRPGGTSDFPINGVIAGFSEALQLMSVGSRWTVYMPPEVAYGPTGAGNSIPPNAILVFDMELVEILTP